MLVKYEILYYRIRLNCLKMPILLFRLIYALVTNLSIINISKPYTQYVHKQSKVTNKFRNRESCTNNIIAVKFIFRTQKHIFWDLGIS